MKIIPGDGIETIHFGDLYDHVKEVYGEGRVHEPWMRYPDQDITLHYHGLLVHFDDYYEQVVSIKINKCIGPVDLWGMDVFSMTRSGFEAKMREMGIKFDNNTSPNPIFEDDIFLPDHAARFNYVRPDGLITNVTFYDNRWGGRMPPWEGPPPDRVLLHPNY
jgi:hypothetical protein